MPQFAHCIPARNPYNAARIRRQAGGSIRFLALIALFGAAAAFADGALHLRLDPHAYFGPRGNEPASQLTALTTAIWHSAPEAKTPFRVQFHLEAETQGRRDVSIDLDEAWVRHEELTLGRIHPFALVDHPAASDPWGLLSSRQAQQKGLLLGYGFDPKRPIPEPRLLGWVGVHYTKELGAFTIGASASPIFIPEQGSEVVVTTERAASAGRFARRPPDKVRLDERDYPLRISVDKSRVVQDVIVRPQLAAYARWKPDTQWSSWLTFLYGPSAQPTFETDGHLNVASGSVIAVANARPIFPQRNEVNFTQAWHFTPGQSIYGSVFVDTMRTWGTEVGWKTPYTRLSLLHANPRERDPDRYDELLAQADLQVPIFWELSVFSGVKHHLRQRDLWWRQAVRVPLSRSASLDVGADFLAGPADSYFGEWRSNDRVFLVFQCEIGS